MVDAGSRARGGYCVPEDRRGLPEGERQHDRLRNLPFAAAAPEDRRGDDQRRRAGCVSEQPGRDHCPLRLERYAGRPFRRRGDAAGGIHRDRAAHGQLLQQCREETQRLRCTLYGRCVYQPCLAVAGSEGRLQNGGHPEELGCLLRFLQGRAERSAQAGHAPRLWPWVPGDHQRRRLQLLLQQFLIGYGGQDIVTKDGKLHLDDPKVREAALHALTYPTTAYKEGFVPPGAINWNDADDNSAFHAKQIVMDLDGSLSTEVAVLSQGKKEDYDDIVTMGLALSNDGRPVPSR